MYGKLDYQRKRHREDDRFGPEITKRTSDHDSRRNSDHDSRPVKTKHQCSHVAVTYIFCS